MKRVTFNRLRSIQKVITKRNAVIGILAVIGLSLFLSIYDGIQEKDDLALFDTPLLEWAVSHQNETLVFIMHLVTDILSPIAISVGVVTGVVVWIWHTKQYRRPFILIGAMAAAFVLSALIKTFTARDRPTLTDLLQSPGAISYSFPSGHTIGVAVLVFTLGYFYCVAAPTLRRVIIASAIAVGSIALVAFSRVYLGYHWLTDVTASVGLAFVILAVVIAVDTYLPQHQKKPTS